MGQITWRNVDAPDLSNAVRTQQLAVKNFQDALTNIAAIPGQTAENVQAGIDRTDTTLLNNFLSNLYKMDSSKGIEQAESDGTFDNLLAGVTDEKQLKAKDAVQTQLDTVLGREKNKQALDIEAAKEADRVEQNDYEISQRAAAEALAKANLQGQRLRNQETQANLDSLRARENAARGINLGVQGVGSAIADGRKQYVAASTDAITEALKNGGMKSDFKIEHLLNPFNGSLDLNAVNSAFPDLGQRQTFLDAYWKRMRDPKVEALRIGLSGDSIVGRQMAIFRKNNPLANALEIAQAQQLFEAEYTKQTTGSPAAKAKVAQDKMAFLDRHAPTSSYARTLRANLQYGVSGLSEFLGTKAGMDAAAKLSKLHVRSKDVLASFIRDNPDMGIPEYLEIVNKAVSLSPAQTEKSSFVWNDFFGKELKAIQKRNTKAEASAIDPREIDAGLAGIDRGSPSLNPGADYAQLQSAIQAGSRAIADKVAKYTANPIEVGRDVFGPMGQGNRASTTNTYVLTKAIESIEDTNSVTYKLLQLALDAKRDPKNRAKYYKDWQKLTLDSNGYPDAKDVSDRTNFWFNQGKPTPK